MKGLLCALFALALGCSTVQTQAVKHIDEVLKSGTLDKKTPIGYAERQAYKAVMIEARGEIVDLTKKKAAAEQKAEKNARLARQAVLFWIGFAVFGALILIFSVRAVLRRVLDHG